jgi:SAM-dependent methyltransferase
MLIAAGVRRVLAVEPSIEGFEALKRNTAHQHGRVEYLNILGQELPAGLGLDFVLSIGVIHHIPDPGSTMRACFSALKPGGRCLVWLYGREGNSAYLGLVLPLRKLTTALPHWLLAGLCHALNFILDGYILLCRRLPMPLRDYALNVLGRMSRDKRYLVIYDQLKPAYAKYYTEAEARELMSRAGFSDILLHHRHGYSWTVVGTRPA